MSKTHNRVVVNALSAALLLSAGCGGSVNRTDFLSDYTRLQPDRENLRYVDRAELAKYRQFIVDFPASHNDRAHAIFEEGSGKSRCLV